MAKDLPFPDGKTSAKDAVAFLSGYGSLAGAEMAQVNRVWTALAQRGLAAGVASGLAFMRCRNPQDLIAAQAGLLCDELELLRTGYGEMSEIVARGAAEAVRLFGKASGETADPS